jgi:large subunit ribosomal protein L18e
MLSHLCKFLERHKQVHLFGDSKANMPRQVMQTDGVIADTVWALRMASKSTKAPLWKDMERRLLNARSNRREVNVDKLSKFTQEGDVIIVPGKILGAGNLGHSIIVYAYSMSKLAARKINEAGGQILELRDLIQRYPNGSGVKIIG